MEVKHTANVYNHEEFCFDSNTSQWLFWSLHNPTNGCIRRENSARYPKTFDEMIINEDWKKSAGLTSLTFITEVVLPM